MATTEPSALDAAGVVPDGAALSYKFGTDADGRPIIKVFLGANHERYLLMLPFDRVGDIIRLRYWARRISLMGKRRCS